jgi:hypothetical protein
VSNIPAEFVMLSESALFAKYSWRSPIIIYDDGIGGADDADPTPCGIGVRFKLPCVVDSVRLDYSFFASACRAHKIRRANSTQDPDRYQWVDKAALEMYIEPFLDGVALPAKKIYFPKSMKIGVTTSPSVIGTDNHITSHEHRTAQQYRNFHVVTGMTAGLHTFEIRVRIESPGDKTVTGSGNGRFVLEDNDKLGRKAGALPKSQGFSAIVHQRLTFGSGCVTMRAIGLNQP